MYIFNKITVNPQLPKRISKLSEISKNLWWSWNTDFLKLFRIMDIDLWERCNKNPVKFLKNVSQEKIEQFAVDSEFLNEYDRVVENYNEYMSSKNTWFNKNYSENVNDVISYFSAEYGIDEIMSIYSGGLGILSGDHLKSSSDLGIPLVAIGLLYKNGYFSQRIDRYGTQQNVYNQIDLESLPIEAVKVDNEDLIIDIDFPNGKLFVKVWVINVGRVKLYLLDTDIENNLPEYRGITLKLYGGDREMRIQQEIVLGMVGVRVLKKLGITPTIYHMNEGHSSFLVLETIKNVIEEKKVSFNIAKDIISAKTLFTTHTPVPAGNDMFDLSLLDKYFYEFWNKLGITREEFLKLGMSTEQLNDKFNMGMLALKVAGKKNGVSKLHGAVSRELFSDVWSNIPANESPIDYVTNGIHTCSWLAPNLKDLYNDYLTPYWQDRIHLNETWNKIQDIPNEKLWNVHLKRKESLFKLVKEIMMNRYKKGGMPYSELNDITSKLTPNALTIGFARRFATYKRATLIFKDLERITQILSDEKRPVQIIFAGKAHPQDKEGQDLIRYINEIALMPQFKGKVFLLENYNMYVARYLVSGVDVWLNNPRRPMEASGTSGQKAAVNGVLNFSILDGWWAEGYNTKNGWAIGTNAEYSSYEEQDIADSESIYNILENKIIPTYYNKNENGISQAWLQLMKNSIISNGGEYSTARMLIDYTNKFYMPLCNLTNKYYNSLELVTEYNAFKQNLFTNWDKIKITQTNNFDNITIDAGNNIEVTCNIKLPNIRPQNVDVQAYYGKILDNGVFDNISVIPMEIVNSNEETMEYKYSAKVELKTGGEYGYTFRVMPKHEMLPNSEDLNLIKWIEK